MRLERKGFSVNSFQYLFQGLFSRITFNQPVFIGGSGGTRNVKNFLGVDNGIQACVRHLEINDKLYNLNIICKNMYINLHNSS